jgi:hypothetical protein
VHRLATTGKYYFLSRPRHFGKSLFLDTLAELFAGNEPLFRGLYYHDKWDWTKKHPVIRISFAEGRLESREGLETHIADELDANAQRLGLDILAAADSHLRFRHLIQQAVQRHGQRVVVLVDEYDKPILDNLTDPEVAHAIARACATSTRSSRGKTPTSSSPFLQVSPFSTGSIFSGLNNLRDITVSAEYSAICGYTEADANTVFAPELEGLDRQAIRDWYNGYNWLGDSVYNPFDVLLLQERTFGWFETGTPTFLVDLLRSRQTFTPQLDTMVADDQLLGAFDVEYIGTEALLWQTGYLTITGVERLGGLVQYQLGYPKREVESAFNQALLRAWVPPQVPTQPLLLLKKWFALDWPALRAHFESLFASIPADWYRANPVLHYEGYWASVLYSHLASLGLDLTPEDVTNQGRIDLTLELPQAIVIIEFKRIDGDQPTGEAIAQLRQRGYADKYRADGRPIWLLGVEFSSATRNVVG